VAAVGQDDGDYALGHAAEQVVAQLIIERANAIGPGVHG
jgi:hypothetical protein